MTGQTGYTTRQAAHDIGKLRGKAVADKHDRSRRGAGERLQAGPDRAEARRLAGDRVMPR